MADKRALADRIRSAREMAGLSQGQAAKLMKLHRPTISEIEAGRRNVKAEELTAFANLYGVEMSWIASGEVGEEKLSKDILAAARELSSMNEDDLETLISTIKIIKSKGKSVE